MDSAIQNRTQPTVVRYMQSLRTGVESQRYSRYVIGYVIRGKKYVYKGDSRYEINRGEVFCLDIGVHYIEDIPDGDKPCEQIVFYLTSDTLVHTMSMLQKEYGMVLSPSGTANGHTNGNGAVNGNGARVISAVASSTMKTFFRVVSHYDKTGVFANHEIAERMTTTILLYMLLSNEENAIYEYLLNKTSMISESFERIVHSSVFDNISIAALAERCNMSPTSFKKEFRRVFDESPHRWFIRQRMIRSRHLLISTDKSVVDIGEECGFANTSHYIKLFKSEYGITPYVYRQIIRQGSSTASHKEVERA